MYNYSSVNCCSVFFPQDLSTNESGLLQVTLEGIGLKFATRRVSCPFALASRYVSDFLVNTNRNIKFSTTNICKLFVYRSFISFIRLFVSYFFLYLIFRYFLVFFCRCTLTCVTSEIVPHKEVCFSWRNLVSLKPIVAFFCPSAKTLRATFKPAFTTINSDVITEFSLQRTRGI